MKEHFIIRFERSGGFTGMGTDRIIDSKELGTEESEMLLSMIESARFFNLAPDKKGSSQPDSFIYKITVELAGRKHMIEFSQASVPESLKNLLKYLIEKIRPGKK